MAGILKAPLAYKPKYGTYKAVPPPPPPTTQGLQPYTGYEGPGVQELINQGKIPWDKGMGNIGYVAPPPAAQGGMWDYGGQWGGGGGGGGDYASLIGGDYEVQAAETAMASRMARARGDYTADIRRAFIDLGLGDASQIGAYGKEIDAETMKAAANNKYSMTAQIAQAAERGRATNNASLAARGILSSGQTTKSQTDVTAGAEKGRYEALQGFLSGALSGKRSLADLSDQLAQGVAMARAAAAQRAAEMDWMTRSQPGYGVPWYGVPGSNTYDYSGVPEGFSTGSWLPQNYNWGGLLGGATKKKKAIPRYNPYGFVGGK